MVNGAALLGVGVAAGVGALAGVGMASLARSKHDRLYAALGALLLGGNAYYIASQVEAATASGVQAATVTSPPTGNALVPNVVPTNVNAATPESST